MLKYVNQHGCWVLIFDWCYAKSMLDYVIKQLSMSNYPYKSSIQELCLMLKWISTVSNSA